MTSGLSDSNNRQSGKSGFWGKPLVENPEITHEGDLDDSLGDGEEPESLRKALPRIMPSEQMEQLPEVEDETESAGRADSAVFVPVPEVVSEFKRSSMPGSVPSWLAEPDEDDGFASEEGTEFDEPFVVEANTEELEATESLPRLDEAGNPVFGITEVHQALSWDSDPSEAESNKLARLFSRFGAKRTPTYESESSVYDEGQDLRHEKRSKRIRIAAIVASVLLACGLVYGLGVQRFSDRILPRTYVCDLDISGLTQEEALKALEDATASYSCTLRAGKFEGTVSGADIGMERNEERIAKAAIKGGSAYAWPLALLTHKQVDVDQEVKFNEESLASKVNEVVDDYNRKAVTSNDIEVTYNEESGLYELTGTASGKAVIPDKVFGEAKECVKGFGSTCEMDTKNVVHKATVQDIPAYARVVEHVNRVRTTEIPITVNGETVITSDPGQNAAWVTVGEGPSVAIDEEAVRWWAESSVQYSVYHVDEWNYYYLDQDAFVQQLCEHFSNGDVSPIEAPTIEQRTTEGLSRDYAYERGGWNSEMGRYIDVDLEAQFARLFDENGNVIWESATVTGNMYEGRSTVTGTFQIYSMDQGVVLVGFDYNNDGQPDYESYVNYWMPFYGGYGLHDATWRGTFGGDLYAYDGSHGCVNLPYSKAAELYGLTFVGETVYVHW